MASANLTDQMKEPVTGGVVCYSPTLITTNGIWQGNNPLEYSLPLFIIQVILVVVTTRVLVLLLKPLHQPRVVAEIIGGILLGPSCLGKVKIIGESVFPTRSLLTLETVAHVGLLYFLFLVGVEMDVMVIKRTGRRALVIAVAGMVLPFGIGVAASYGLQRHVSQNIHQASFLLFIGVALAVTAFPVLARILAESKLLNTEIGRIAMSSAIVNDMCAWILLALSIALAESGSGDSAGKGNSSGNALASLWVLLSGVAFVLFCFYAVRPAMRWVMKRTPEGEGVSDFYVCLILTGVMLAGLTTDAIGIHSVFGAFVFGLVIPNGSLGVALIEKLEDFVTGLLLPLFFVISGLRTNLATVRDMKAVVPLAVVFLLASVGKILGTVLIAIFFTMSFRDGVALGFLMNTRGLVEMIVLNIGRDKEVLDDESFAVMVLASVVMTAMVTPVVMAVHRPTRRLIGYKRRNLQRSKPDVELRMLACVHNTRNVPALISLLDLSHPTKRSPIFVYALHLVELTNRASSMLIAHSAAATSKPHSSGHSASTTGTHAQADHIFAAFESYEQHAGGVSVQAITTVSTYGSMHEDICALAEEKHVTLIVLPFHKQQTVDGAMEPINSAIRTLNEGVLATAPCSVAVLVDRGLSAASRAAPAHPPTHHVALLFFGGPDDREALAYASRMVEHPGVTLLVIRFLPGDDLAVPTSPSAAARDSRVITIVTDSSRQRQLDDECMNEFRLRNVSNESVAYTERVVNSSEETVAALRAMESIHDLYIVGRGQGEATPMTAALAEWMECPELGPIGDLLASSDFSATVSVLVVQQYVGGALGPDVPGASAESPTGGAVKQYLNNANQRMSVVAGTHRGAAPASLNVTWNGR
ncbi:cation/H(+) antiporter 15 [Phoenix dactylifera]|uniref:Cation/H(+) antiporter 15 n=1 Tax=Phoenix dactylifera TaxID=42345 RepID=A0A8B8JA92_PHODC|nr:cation/H(+) antiporter 15 [Phoenix dactylifera]